MIMKKILLAVTVFFCIQTLTYAQGAQGETTEMGALTIMTPIDKKLGGGGIGINLGILYGLTDNICVGFIGEAALSFMAPKDTTVESSNLSLWYGGKAVGEYYFSTGKVKPFLGYGLGALKIGGITSGAEADTYSGWKFTHGPRAGILLGNFRLSVEYSFIPSKFNSGKQKYNLGYLGFTIGSHLGSEW
jgi:hypothetical protein